MRTDHSENFFRHFLQRWLHLNAQSFSINSYIFRAFVFQCFCNNTKFELIRAVFINYCQFSSDILLASLHYLIASTNFFTSNFLGNNVVCALKSRATVWLPPASNASLDIQIFLSLTYGIILLFNIWMSNLVITEYHTVKCVLLLFKWCWKNC